MPISHPLQSVIQEDEEEYNPQSDSKYIAERDLDCIMSTYKTVSY